MRCSSNEEAEGDGDDDRQRHRYRHRRRFRYLKNSDADDDDDDATATDGDPAAAAAIQAHAVSESVLVSDHQDAHHDQLETRNTVGTKHNSNSNSNSHHMRTVNDLATFFSRALSHSHSHSQKIQLILVVLLVVIGSYVSTSTSNHTSGGSLRTTTILPVQVQRLMTRRFLEDDEEGPKIDILVQPGTNASNLTSIAAGQITNQTSDNMITDTDTDTDTDGTNEAENSTATSTPTTAPTTEDLDDSDSNTDTDTKPVNITSIDVNNTGADITFENNTYLPTIYGLATVSPSSVSAPSPTPTRTEQPTIPKQPTIEPSFPSEVIYDPPTEKPTGIPTLTPTISNQPTVSMVPSYSPTISTQPSIQPSIAPSNTPTTTPAPTLSMVPSSVPSVAPTTSEPTQRPSASPTRSTQPSFRPSQSPTYHPTLSPAPSALPTASAQPTSSMQPSSPPPTIAIPGILYNRTAIDIVMIIAHVPTQNFTSEQITIWENVTSQHLIEYYAIIAATFPDQWPITVTNVVTTFLNSTSVVEERNGGGVNSSTVMTTTINDNGLSNDDTYEKDGKEYSSSKTYENSRHYIPAQKTAPPLMMSLIGEEKELTIMNITYKQQMEYWVPETNVTQDVSNDLWEQLFVVPYEMDAFSYSIELITAMDWSTFVVVDQIFPGMEEVTVAPTPAPSADDDTNGKPLENLTWLSTLAISASIILAAIILVSFLLWDRTRKPIDPRYADRYDGEFACSPTPSLRDGNHDTEQAIQQQLHHHDNPVVTSPEQEYVNGPGYYTNHRRFYNDDGNSIGGGKLEINSDSIRSAPVKAMITRSEPFELHQQQHRTTEQDDPVLPKIKRTSSFTKLASLLHLNHHKNEDSNFPSDKTGEEPTTASALSSLTKTRHSHSSSLSNHSTSSRITLGDRSFGGGGGGGENNNDDDDDNENLAAMQPSAIPKQIPFTPSSRRHSSNKISGFDNTSGPPMTENRGRTSPAYSNPNIGVFGRRRNSSSNLSNLIGNTNLPPLPPLRQPHETTPPMVYTSPLNNNNLQRHNDTNTPAHLIRRKSSAGLRRSAFGMRVSSITDSSITDLSYMSSDAFRSDLEDGGIDRGGPPELPTINNQG